MKPSATVVAQSIRVADRWLCSKQEFELSWYDLEHLADGKHTLLYHGTTKLFSRFDVSKSREELVKDYYGGGIFLTPKKSIAWDYATANRNIGFDPSLLDDLRRVYPNAAAFLTKLTKSADESDVWDEVFESLPPHELGPAFALDKHLGVDANVLSDVAPYILGSKAKPLGSSSPINIFSQSTGAPDWLYDRLDELGLDSNKYRPKVYTVLVSGLYNPLITTRLPEARKARANGYDSVVYHGSQVVKGVPEVAVFDPKKIKVLKYEV